ncbi:MAG: phosphatidate cytidylyltransferase [Eubacteriales bacterium]|nr:phosphatidate cytidylyltransferase [Eubacteriales bacterium]
MFWVRLRSGIILVVIALLTVISGGYILFGTTLAISLIGLGELYRAAGIAPTELREKDQKPGWALALTGYLSTVSYYACLLFFGGRYSMMLMILILTAFLFVYVFTFPKYHAEQVMAGVFGVLYVSVMLSYLYLTRQMPDGAFIVWLVVISSWGCDTCAYCVGMLIGKHKMSPILSPKKSIEGAVGGVLGAALLGALYAAIVGKYLQAEDQILIYALICGVGALISMVGDLAASAIKRNRGIKDYGTLIPGHGGILDRFDSMIFTAPMIYFLATALVRL